MATINLLPDAEVTTQWSPSSLGAQTHDMVNVDEGVNPGAIGDSYMMETTAGHIFTVEFPDFEEKASSIDGVQAHIKVGQTDRGGTYDIRTTLLDGSGTIPSILYAEGTGTLAARRTYRDIALTNRTTTDGSTAWSVNVLNSLQLMIEAEAISTGDSVLCTYCYVTVTYTPLADNSIFFGTNF